MMKTAIEIAKVMKPTLYKTIVYFLAIMIKLYIVGVITGYRVYVIHQYKSKLHKVGL